jgi:alkylhydroperoxidase/carboxymuconolactone decarboxylase family protein YurZ
MSHYHDSDDLKMIGEFKSLAPAEFKASLSSKRSSGATTARSRASIASSLRSPSRARRNARTASMSTRATPKKAGATREEVTEASFIAAALRAGAAVTHGALALKLFDKA